LSLFLYPFFISFSNNTFYVKNFSMSKTICITNQKGGVGKTTTAINLSSALAVCEKKTLLVDCDPQANATTGLGIDKTTLDKSLYHGLIGEEDVKNIIVDSCVKGLSVIPSRVELIGFEVEMMAEPESELTLKQLIGEVKDDFDYIIIDCPPSLSLLTVNALTASDYMLVPLQCEFYALEGVGQLVQTMQRIRQSFNPSLEIGGILLTMFDTRTNLSHQVAEDAKNHFKELVFSVKIPRNIRLSEAPSFGMPILSYDASSAGAKSYMELAREIINRM